MLQVILKNYNKCVCAQKFYGLATVNSGECDSILRIDSSYFLYKKSQEM